MMKLALLGLATCAAFAPPAAPARRATLLFSDAGGSFRYDNSDSVSPLEKKQALQDTAQWCLDRCIKLGHCEVFEDLNKMSTARRRAHERARARASERRLPPLAGAGPGLLQGVRADGRGDPGRARPRRFPPPSRPAAAADAPAAGATCP